jgi:hypothetical protein
MQLYRSLESILSSVVMLSLVPVQIDCSDPRRERRWSALLYLNCAVTAPACLQYTSSVLNSSIVLNQIWYQTTYWSTVTFVRPWCFDPVCPCWTSSTPFLHQTNQFPIALGAIGIGSLTISSPQKLLTEQAYHRSVSHWPSSIPARTGWRAEVTDQANPVSDALTRLSIAMTERLYGKCFFKWIGPIDCHFRKGLDRLIV